MKTFVKETVGNQLKNEITSFKSAVESNLNNLGNIVTKKVKPKTEPPTNDHSSGLRVRGIPELKDTNARKLAELDKAEIENILKFLMSILTSKNVGELEHTTKTRTEQS